MTPPGKSDDLENLSITGLVSLVRQLLGRVETLEAEITALKAEKVGNTSSHGNSDARYYYDLAGNIRRKLLPNQTAEDKQYDAAGRTALQATYRGAGTAGVTLVSSIDYKWDAWGAMAHQLDARAAVGSTLAAVSRRVVNFYDGLDRLLKEEVYDPGKIQPSTTTAWTYDKANNRTSQTRGTWNAATGATTSEIENYDHATATYAFPGTSAAQPNEATVYAPNQLRRISKNGVDTAVFRYDKNGSRVRKWESGGGTDGTVTLYTWNRANQLAQVKRTVGTADPRVWKYAYDHRGRRIFRDEPGTGATGAEVESFANGTSASRWFVADATPGAALIMQNLSVEFIRGSDYGGGVGGVLYTIQHTSGEPRRYFEYGARGDVTGQSDETGTGTFRAVYQAFGDHTESGTSSPGRQRASTKDEETELTLLNEGFRYRDIQTGAFLSRDPAGFVDGPNLYSYVTQNPWSHFDPEGLEKPKISTEDLRDYRDSLRKDVSVLKGELEAEIEGN